MEYVRQFDHLPHYAPEYVSTDADKKFWFLHGLDIELQIVLVGKTEASYNETVSMAISAKYIHNLCKEAKKRKKMLEESSSDGVQP